MKKLAVLIALALVSTSCSSAGTPAPDDSVRWDVQADDSALSLYFDGKCIAEGVYACAKLEDGTVVDTRTLTLKNRSVSRSHDELGENVKFCFTFSGTVEAELDIFAYCSGRDCLTAQLTLRSEDVISSNYMAPLCWDTPARFLPVDESLRSLHIPFDNDDFVHYYSYPFPHRNLISFEATAFFNGISRDGLILGSIDHDCWKSAIEYSTGADGSVERLRCYGGANHRLTRDLVNPKKGAGTNQPHGFLRGRSVSSPRFFVAFAGDWRRGLEEFGEACAAVAPPRRWTGGTPFGWNSWGDLAFDLDYHSAIGVSDYFRDTLTPAGFGNDGVVYIGLDSGWSALGNRISDFADHCHKAGQKAGIYWCPFSDWGGRADKVVEGTDGKYTYGDLYLRSDGVPRKVESLALDPTHEGTRMRMKDQIEKFKEWGFDYLKVDFLNNGTLEADSFADSTVTTGVQAYNSGMKYLCELCGDDMFLTLSIAPVFPAGYGHARRISCDTWGAMTERDWGSTGYMLNSLSFGWWLDRVYAFNDPDHARLVKPDEAADFGEGATRARITSLVITGLVMLTDNFSTGGRHPGSAEARSRAEKYATLERINRIALDGNARSFYPVEGWKAAGPGKSETQFMRDDGEWIYVAVFNFSASDSSEGMIAFDRLGLTAGRSHRFEELWTGARGRSRKGLSFSVPTQDVRVFKVWK